MSIVNETLIELREVPPTPLSWPEAAVLIAALLSEAIIEAFNARPKWDE